MIPLILNWAQAYAAGFMACGGKGYHLAKLHRYGFPVPDGGVVVTDVYQQLMQAPVLAERMQAINPLRAEDVTAPMVQEELAHLQQSIMAAVPPAQVRTELEHFLREHHLADRAIAVRSHAVNEDAPNASFAGMHQSVLNVRGVDAICRAILQCYAMPFFLGPHIDTVIACLPTCQGPDNPPKYPPITYEQYLLWWYDANYHAAVQNDRA